MDAPALKNIVVIAASEMTVKAFLREHLAELSTKYRVTVVLNTTDPLFLENLGLRATLVALPIAREISIWRDVHAVLKLWKILREGKFDLQHSVTPKAGLVSAIAGCLARVPRRLHTFTGQVWVTRKGPMRHLLKLADWLIARLSTHVLADSFSQRDFLIDQGVVGKAKISVLGEGSICGVDVARFRPDPEARHAVRQALGLREQDTVFLFLGRLKRDKGVLDLVSAFAGAGTQYADAHLVLVGPDEDGLVEPLRRLAGAAAERLHCVGYTDAPERYFAMADVFCLPSYREGFGTSILEAAATGVPAIGSRIYGITDAIVENRTGLLFAPGNAAELAGKLQQLYCDRKLRLVMGEAARARALHDFPVARLTGALLAFYDHLW